MAKSKTDFGAYIASYADFPRSGILFRDISPLLASNEGMTRATDEFVELLSCYQIDAVAGIESRGFLFSTLLAMRLRVGSLMIRKPGKLPGDLAHKKHDLEYGSSELTVQKLATIENQNILIVDDLLATGGTLAAAIELLVAQHANVVACAVVIELLALGGREKLARPIVALESYND